MVLLINTELLKIIICSCYRGQRMVRGTLRGVTSYPLLTLLSSVDGVL